MKRNNGCPTPAATHPDGSLGCGEDVQQARDIDRLSRFAEKQIENSGIKIGFPYNIARLAEDDLPARTLSNRRDLRHLCCFTLDCKDTKDMDDAISLEKTEAGYLLGIHIANVAAYVHQGSELDEVAFSRGTSIYLPHMTIPMLPHVLSDQLCSLNEGEDRETISVLVEVSPEGEVLGCEITESVIRSRMKMDYRSANRFLNDVSKGMTTPRNETESQLVPMAEIALKLLARRKENGARIYRNGNPQFAFADGDLVLEPYRRGLAERIVEEFAVLANRMVAEFFCKNGLPMIVRAQNKSGTCAGYKLGRFHHADLALERYFHFTSPIRRLSDLKIGQMLLDFLEGMPASGIWERCKENMEQLCLLIPRRGSAKDVFEEFCDHMSKRSRRAKNIQAACERFCRCVFFDKTRGQVFKGSVCGAGRDGFLSLFFGDFDMAIKAEDPGDLKIGQAVEFCVDANPHNNSYIVHDWMVWAA